MLPHFECLSSWAHILQDRVGKWTRRGHLALGSITIKQPFVVSKGSMEVIVRSGGCAVSISERNVKQEQV